MGCCCSASGTKRATDNLQQGRFTAAVAADDADGFSFLDFKRYISKRPEFPEVVLGLLAKGVLHSWQDELLEPVARGIVDLIALAEILHANGDVVLFFVHAASADCP